jgi:small subunit ribosomal protein S7
MSRRRGSQKRAIIPDHRYKSVLVTEFINNLNRQGKKSIAENIFYSALEIIGQKNNEEDALTTFKKAVDNVKPTLEVKSRRIGGANYQVPNEVPTARKNSLAIRWIIAYSKERSEKSLAEKLAAELLQACKGEGGAVRKRIDTHKMAEANKAFAHFRW